MTIEEKIAHINELLTISGNVAKLMRAVLAQSLPSLQEGKLDEIIALLDPVITEEP